MNTNEISPDAAREVRNHGSNGDSRMAELEARLAIAEETLRAIRSGEVDALVVEGPDGAQIFSLEGADHAYRMLVEEMQEGTVTMDTDGLILYANRQFATMMRAPVETIVGSRIHRFLTPEPHAFFGAMLAGRGGRSEITLLAADGTPVPAALSVNRLQTGGIQTVCAVVTDLTEQRNYEAMVKDGELSPLILDQVAEAIVVIDAQGKILRASESAHRLAGRNVLLHPFDLAFQLSAAESGVGTSHLLSRAPGFRSAEVTMRHSDGQSSTLLLSSELLFKSAREMLGCVVTLTDITPRKRAEDVLERQAHELERSNNDLRQFAYAVSHDLREPIRTLSVYNQLLEKRLAGTLDEQAVGFIRHTVEAAQRLEALLDGLLAYTQAAEGPHVPSAVVDANIILANTMKMFEEAFAESGASFRSDPLPMLRMEDVHLQQLFQNLIGNSLKYRGTAPPRIHISAQREKGMWTLSVADNGIGMDAQYHKQIFGLFKRLHGSNKYAGSGIGLAICQKIVERYGGRMWVESEIGKGSSFHFTLPDAKLNEKA